MFQFTRPQGARPEALEGIGINAKFQFTRPQGARPCRGSLYCYSCFVSIHAPTRGATRVYSIAGVKKGVSIHAPTRGATSSHHVGAWLRTVSIHAPTRGATNDFLSKMGNNSFNSRAHKGRDLLDISETPLL